MVLSDDDEIKDGWIGYRELFFNETFLEKIFSYFLLGLIGKIHNKTFTCL
jgi:hypothetical protein